MFLCRRSAPPGLQQKYSASCKKPAVHGEGATGVFRDGDTKFEELEDFVFNGRKVTKWEVRRIADDGACIFERYILVKREATKRDVIFENDQATGAELLEEDGDY